MRRLITPHIDFAWDAYLCQSVASEEIFPHKQVLVTFVASQASMVRLGKQAAGGEGGFLGLFRFKRWTKRGSAASPPRQGVTGLSPVSRSLKTLIFNTRANTI